MHITVRTRFPKLVSGLLALAVWCVGGAVPACAASMAEVNGWLASTNKVVRVPPPPGMHPDGPAEYVRVAGTDGSGWVIPSAGGHLDVTVMRGVVVVRTPIYKAGDANCCPSAIHYERDTLRGIRLVTLSEYDAKR